MGDVYIDTLPDILRMHKDDIDDVKFSTHVVGSTFYPHAQEIISLLRKVPQDNIILKFLREPDNEYDPYAVAIHVSITNSTKEYMIGHVPRDGARVLSYVLLHDNEYSMKVTNIHIAGGDEQREMFGLFFDFSINKL